MASIVLGSISLTTSSSATQPRVDKLSELKSCIAGYVGGEDQDAVLSTAKEGVLRCIDDLNIRHNFRFGRKSAADVTLTDATATYAIATDFFAIDDIMLINTDSEVERRLEYVTWQDFNSGFLPQDDTGRPKYWTSKNTFDDDTITVYPTPDSTAATDYNIRIQYYERVERPDADTDVIVAPRELSHVICLYGEYYVADRFRHTDQNSIARKYAEYREALQRFQERDGREPARRYSQSQIPVDANRGGTRRGRRTITYVKS